MNTVIHVNMCRYTGKCAVEVGHEDRESSHGSGRLGSGRRLETVYLLTGVDVFADAFELDVGYCWC